MKQLDTYLKGAYPDIITICGVTLQPFSLGHYRLFNKYLGNAKTPEEELMEFFFALAICGRKHNEFLEWMRHPEEVVEWMNLMITENFKESAKDHSYLICQRTTFRKYLKDAYVKYNYWEGSKLEDAKQSGADWTQNVINAITSETNRYSEEQLLDLPVGKVLGDFYKLLEKFDLIQLMSDEEIEQVEELEVQHDSK